MIGRTAWGVPKRLGVLFIPNVRTRRYWLSMEETYYGLHPVPQTPS